MALYFIYIACIGFLIFAGALASSKTDAKCLKIQTKKKVFFARDLNVQEAFSYKSVVFQHYDTKRALAQW